MKSLLLIFLSILVLKSNAQNKLVSIIVKDNINAATLNKCSIYSLNSGISGVTDDFGVFSFPAEKVKTGDKVVISFTGFKNDTILISAEKTTYRVFLHPAQQLLEEVVVTGVSKATHIKENPVAVVSVSSRTIEKTIESNIIDVLTKNVPGLTAVKTGPNISKPFIRGLGYNRVLTLYDGIRQEGQQWGDEHGIEVDGYNLERAEVIKGPASLMFGSDALAGVVSLIPRLPKEKDGKLHGKFTSEYQSNNGLIGNGIRLDYSNEHWMFAGRGSYKLAKNYTNSADGRVYNTGFRENNLAFTAGYNSSKGFTILNTTLYDNLQGIPDGSRDSLTRKFTKQVQEMPVDDIKKRPVVTDDELNSYALSPLHQHIQHYRIYTNNQYRIATGMLDANVAFQQNIRREYNHPSQPNQAGLFVRLNTINYSVAYTESGITNMDISVGVNGMYQSNANKNGTDFPIPDYRLFDAGIFGHAKWKYNKWTISGGVRYDTRQLKGNDFYVTKNPATGFEHQAFPPDTAGARLQFPALRQSFQGTSLSFGLTYQLNNHINLKANIARGYRAPNITEIASNGLDPGAHIVYIGNRNFLPEFSLQEDIGIGFEYPDLSASISIFNNSVQQYIYLAQVVDAQGNPVIAEGNKTFQYQQASAHLYGLEATLNLHPKNLTGFSFNNAFSTIRGINTKSDFKNAGVQGEYLPFIPPLKLLSSVNQQIKTSSKLLRQINLTAEADVNAAQNRYMALYQTETATPGYTLINFSAGADIYYSKNNCVQLQLQVNNLFNTVYQSNLSRLKYFEYYTASSNGRSGIYGMGRNVCVKVVVGL